MDCDSERIWKIVENNRQNIPPLRQQYSKAQASLFDHLHDLYVEEENDKKEKGQRFQSAVNLLKHLDSSLVNPALILNLYSDEEGYSLRLPYSGIDDGECTEIFLPYEEDYIFDYLNNQQIPPVVQEILQSSQCYHSYEGSIVCEVKNFRNSTCDNLLLLLKPTSETMNATINNLSSLRNFTRQEDLSFESQLLLSTQSPICLDPSTDVVCVANRLSYNQKKYNSQSVQRYLLRRSHAARRLRNVEDSKESSKYFKLLDFIKQKSLRSRCFRKFSESWKCRKKPSRPAFIPMVLEEVQKYAKQVIPPSSPCQDHMTKNNLSEMQESITVSQQIIEPIAEPIALEQSDEIIDPLVPPSITKSHSQDSSICVISSSENTPYQLADSPASVLSVEEDQVPLPDSQVFHSLLAKERTNSLCLEPLSLPPATLSIRPALSVSPALSLPPATLSIRPALSVSPALSLPPATLSIPSALSVPPATLSIPPALSVSPALSVPPAALSIPTALSVSPALSVPPAALSIPTALSVSPGLSVPPAALSIPPALSVSPALSVPPAALSIPPAALSIPPALSVPPAALSIPPALSVSSALSVPPAVLSIPPALSVAPAALTIPPALSGPPATLSIPPAALTIPPALSGPPALMSVPLAMSVPPTTLSVPLAMSVPPTTLSVPSALSVPPAILSVPPATLSIPPALSVPPATLSIQSAVTPAILSVPPATLSVQPATLSAPPVALESSVKVPPPLSVWHTTKSSAKGNLPKLHSLKCEPPKVQHSYLKSGQISMGQGYSQGVYMPQLRKITLMHQPASSDQDAETK